ncbi:MAG: tryptophan synthase subunit alpha [Methanomicrobiaceae archaeon]|nr:tryptophan synthase subunit alpha [Methanomicrobiaceae archaeon]
MNRIDRWFLEHAAPAFTGFTVAGDPDPEASVRVARTLVDAGVDILELGMPFSDPVADGPVIQRADQRALAAGTTPDAVFAIARALRADAGVPIVLLTYCNLVLNRGIGQFYRDAREAGIDGVLIVDMPVEESDGVREAARAAGIAPIFLVAPTTSAARQDGIIARASGFLYLVSVLGVTGTRNRVAEETLAFIRQMRSRTALPLAVGFGISEPEHVASCCEAGADAVIVGSAIVAIIERHLGDEEEMMAALSAYIATMRAATGEAPR